MRENPEPNEVDLAVEARIADMPRRKLAKGCFVRPERRAFMSGLSEADILKFDHWYGPCDSPTCPYEHTPLEDDR